MTGWKQLQTAIIFGISLSVTSAWAGKRFANQFIEFELPAKWQCNLEGAEWVCQSVDAKNKKDAIIIMAAKLRGDQDSLDQYLAYLKNPKSYRSVTNKPLRSQPKYAKFTVINQHDWVDSLHLESEIPGFYTRYLATVKQDIGVLVTYSVNKDKYSDYLEEFEQMVKTLRVFRKPGLNAQAKGGSLFSRVQSITGGSAPPLDSIFTPERPADTAGSGASGAGDEDLFTLLLIVGIAGILFIIWRKKRR